MPNYNPSLTSALYVGGQKVLADSTLLTPFTSVAICVGRDPGSDAVLTFTNPSTENAPVYAALVDADANYLPFATVMAGATQDVATGGKFVRLQLAAAPSAPITVAR